MYNKIQIRKAKYSRDKKNYGDIIVNNIILVISGISIFGIIYLSIFTIYLGYRSLKIILGYDLEVYQKQLMEKKNNEKDNIYKKSSFKIKEEPRFNNKDHLKKD